METGEITDNDSNSQNPSPETSPITPGPLNQSPVFNLAPLQTTTPQVFNPLSGNQTIINSPVAITPVPISNSIEEEESNSETESTIKVSATTSEIKCSKGTHLEGNQCVSNTRICTIKDGKGQQKWTKATQKWSSCQPISCRVGFVIRNNKCIISTSGLKKFSAPGVIQTHNPKLKSVNFSSLLGDFDNDGKNDPVSCTGGRVLIKSSRTGGILFDYRTTDKKHPKKKNWILRNARCAVIKHSNKRPSLIVAQHWRDPKYNKYQVTQKYVAYIDGRFRLKTAMIGKSKFTSVARSVKCRKYPHNLINKRLKTNYKEANLCFFPGYRYSDGGSTKSKTAIFKVERKKGGTLKFIDLSSSSGFTWSGGHRGTGSRGTQTACHNDRRAEGLNMMDGAFINTGRNSGLDSLITVGQHSHVRAHHILLSKNAPSGIRFSNEVIYRGSCGFHTEFLTVTSFDERHKNVPHKCVYMTGEPTGGKSFIATYDFLLCMESNGKWVERALPHNFSSMMTPGSIRYVDGQTFIRGHRSFKDGQRAPIYYRLPSAKELNKNKVIRSSSRTATQSSR